MRLAEWAMMQAVYLLHYELRLIAELDEKDKSVIFGLIETLLTKKKFKDFFQKNVAAL